MYGRDALEGVNVVTLLWTLRNPADHHAGATCHCVAAGNTKNVGVWGASSFYSYCGCTCEEACLEVGLLNLDETIKA